MQGKWAESASQPSYKPKNRNKVSEDKVFANNSAKLSNKQRSFITMVTHLHISTSKPHTEKLRTRTALFLLYGPDVQRLKSMFLLFLRHWNVRAIITLLLHWKSYLKVANFLILKENILLKNIRLMISSF